MLYLIVYLVGACITTGIFMSCPESEGSEGVAFLLGAAWPASLCVTIGYAIGRAIK